MKSHKVLDCWKKLREFVTDIYGIAQDFPKTKYMAKSGRCAMLLFLSLNNFNEVAARKNMGEFIQFL